MLSLDEFSLIWKGLFDALVQQAKRFGLDQSAAEDILQDLAIESLQKLPKLHDRMHFQNWAYKTVRFRCLDYISQNSYRNLGSKSTTIPTRETTTSSEVNPLVSALREAIQKLPDRQRGVLEKVLAGETSEEIAKSFKVNIATVRSLKRFALAKVRDQIVRFIENEAKQ